MVRKARQYFLRSRYWSAGILVIAILIVTVVIVGKNSTEVSASVLQKMGPDDGPNQPIGTGIGINPGRVVWVWDPKASNENCINVFDLPKPENTNQGIVNRMVINGIMKLGDQDNLSDSWDAIFRFFNSRKNGVERSYEKGEKIFIKINQGTALNTLRKIDENRGFNLPKSITESKGAKKGNLGTTETYPAVALEILRELVYVVGVDQKDISIGDPIAHIYDYNYIPWSNEFPDVVYIDRLTSFHGRTLITPTKEDLLFYSDKRQSDKLYDVIENADYMINLANLKPHGSAGISLTAKNHFGSQARRTAGHLHYNLVAGYSAGNPTNGGYYKYRVQVDLMGSKYLGQNTLLYLVDGLYGGGSRETRVPVKYFMPPFNNDWSNSIFVSQDQVALESVCYDFLRTEWNGTYVHNPANNIFETMANANGVDDYLHQAADSSNWPEGIIYDPDNSGEPLKSLGTHEHWNNPAKKQYSRNLGRSVGIELVSVPDTLVGGNGPAISTSEMWYKSEPPSEAEQSDLYQGSEYESDTPSDNLESDKIDIKSHFTFSIGGNIDVNEFYSAVVDSDNTKWFLTDVGILSLKDQVWKMHNENEKIPTEVLKGIEYDSSEYGKEIWLSSPKGAIVATLPIDEKSRALSYYSDNSNILSDNVLSLAVGNGSIRWIGTDKGISALKGDEWLKLDYDYDYPEWMFEKFPITDMATSPDGDSLYVGTKGAGVTRFYRDDVDAISGASEYAKWGPIELPSDNINCICIEPDGTQWFGTDAGVARHIGYTTLDNWMVLDTVNGLVDNNVQSIAVDHQGRIWIGTKAGISIYENGTLKSLTKKGGLYGEDIRFIVVDRDGVVYIGNDYGLASYTNGDLIIYKN